MTARELAEKKYGTKDLKDISEFNISLESAISMMEEYKNRGKNLPIFSVIARYFIRALGLPFFMALSLIGALHGWIRYVAYYVVWGGEVAHYKRGINAKTIADVYDKIDNAL